MQVVIKISEEEYNLMKKHIPIPTITDGVNAYNAVVNGTPLPKWLIIADKFIDNLKGIERLHVDDELRNTLLNALYTSTLEVESEE